MMLLASQTTFMQRMSTIKLTGTDKLKQNSLAQTTNGSSQADVKREFFMLCFPILRQYLHQSTSRINLRSDVLYQALPMIGRTSSILSGIGFISVAMTGFLFPAEYATLHVCIAEI